ncbi:MAG: hypothetical protein ACK56F_07940 [bacterium]
MIRRHLVTIRMLSRATRTLWSSASRTLACSCSSQPSTFSW